MNSNVTIDISCITQKNGSIKDEALIEALIPEVTEKCKSPTPVPEGKNGLLWTLAGSYLVGWTTFN